MLNEYSNCVDMANEQTGKSYQIGKVNEYIGTNTANLINDESKHVYNDYNMRKNLHNNNNAKKYGNELNNNKNHGYSKIATRSNIETKYQNEKTKTLNGNGNENENRQIKTSKNHTSSSITNSHELNIKKKEVENFRNNTNQHNMPTKETNVDNQKNNKNHIYICKVCYLHKVQKEIEQLKEKKQRTTVYPREFSDYMQYENIHEIIVAKKKKMSKCKKMDEIQMFADSEEEQYNESSIKGYPEQISVKKNMFHFLNHVFKRN